MPFAYSSTTTTILFHFLNTVDSRFLFTSRKNSIFSEFFKEVLLFCLTAFPKRRLFSFLDRTLLFFTQMTQPAISTIKLKQLSMFCKRMLLVFPKITSRGKKKLTFTIEYPSPLDEIKKSSPRQRVNFLEILSCR